MTLNRIQNEAHAIQAILKSLLFCFRVSSQTYLEGFSVAKNCLRHEIVPLNLFAI